MQRSLAGLNDELASALGRGARLPDRDQHRRGRRGRSRRPARPSSPATRSTSPSGSSRRRSRADPDRDGDVPARQGRRHGRAARAVHARRGRASGVDADATRRRRRDAPPGYARRLDAPLVGRAGELATLEAAIERRFVDEGRCGVVTLRRARRGSASRGSRARSRRVSTGERRVAPGRCLAVRRRDHVLAARRARARISAASRRSLGAIARRCRRRRGARAPARGDRRVRRSPLRATSSSGVSGGCSRQSPATGRCSSASRISTGPSRRCSISSSTSSRSQRRRSSCCATRDRSSWRRGRAGRATRSRARTSSRTTETAELVAVARRHGRRGRRVRSRRRRRATRCSPSSSPRWSLETGDGAAGDDSSCPASIQALLAARLDSLDARGTPSARARLGRRQGVLASAPSRTSRHADDRAQRRGCAARARAQGARRARARGETRRGHVPASATRLIRDVTYAGIPKSDARGPARGLRRWLAAQPAGLRRARRDRRLPRRAGVRVSLRARARRRRGRARSPSRRRELLGSRRPAGVRREDMPAAADCSDGRSTLLAERPSASAILVELEERRSWAAGGSSGRRRLARGGHRVRGGAAATARTELRGTISS